MDKIFYPASIAIIGLSSRPTNIPRLTLENLLRWGYRGRLFGVNERSDDIHVDGIKMFKKIEDLPEAPDLAYCMVPAKLIPGLMERCGKFGIKRMAIPSGGFSEYSESGAALASALLAIARKYNIRFVGPNSVTVANTENGLCLPFVALHKVPPGGLSIISQSGGVALTMLNYLEDEKIGLAKFASIGNKLDLDEIDFLQYFGRDQQTKVICLYLESISRGRELIETAKAINKPVIVFKANTTEAGKTAAMSHTAAMGNDEEITSAAFEEAGIIRIDNFLDFVEVAKAFHLPPLKGNRLMIMSPAGGFSVLGADLCEKAGFAFADMGADFYESLKQFSNAGVIKFSNPLDMGDIYDPKLTAHVFHAVMHANEVDGAIYISQRPQMPAGENIFHTMFLTDLSKEAWGSILSSGKPLGICLFGPTRMIQQTKRYVEFPIFNSPEELVRALYKQMHFYQKREEIAGHKVASKPAGLDKEKALTWVREKTGDYGEESFALLEAYGIKTIASETALSAAQAQEAAEKLGYPVALKVISPGALHKTEAGGVLLNIAGPEEVTLGFETISRNLKHYDKEAPFAGVRVQKMAPQGHDMFVGGKFDRAFGPVVYFGLGGIYIETIKDVTNLLAPAEPQKVWEHLKKLKAWQFLSGLRGQKAADAAALVDLVVRVSHLLADFPAVRELDINPVRVFAQNQGAVALDARLRLES